MLDDVTGNYDLLFSSRRGRRTYCLCRYGFHLTPHRSATVLEQLNRCTQRFPDVQFLHLCNEPGDVELFLARGAQAIFCSSNCLVDDASFTPMPSLEREFDAVYVARLDKWKRHYLASDLASLALVYYPVPGDDPAYVRQLREDFSHAHFFNHPDSGPYRLLGPKEVNQCLNACRVGLCLSAEEGPMGASVEYLLSGLPVVTTPSQGGRDEFFEDRFVLTVPPEPAAVKEAVRELIARKARPQEIRQATLDKIARHRQRFIALVQSIYDQNGVQRKFADEWDPVFFHRMLRLQSHAHTIARIRQAAPG